MGVPGFLTPRLFLCPGTTTVQDSAFSCRVWITLNKLSYAPLRGCSSYSDIHADEWLCGGLPPSAQRVSEKNSSRQLGEQARFPTRRYGRLVNTYLCGRMKGLVREFVV